MYRCFHYGGVEVPRIIEHRGVARLAQVHLNARLLQSAIPRRREPDDSLLCALRGRLDPWSPLARGILARSRKARNTLRENTDKHVQILVRSRDDRVDEEIIGRLERVAGRPGSSMAQVAVAWWLSKNISPRVGLNRKERMNETVEATNMELSAEDVGYIEEPYQPKNRMGYSHIHLGTLNCNGNEVR